MKRRDPQRRPTSRDVAAAAGVSRTTVSYVINQRTSGAIRISDETRRRVWDAARALDYQPLRAAQSLRLQRSKAIAVLVPQVEDSIWGPWALAMQREVERAGYQCLVFGLPPGSRRTVAAVDSLLRSGVDGLIAHSDQVFDQHLERLAQAGIAAVLHGAESAHGLTDSVGVDEDTAAAEVLAHLVAKGHQRIAAISGPSSRKSWRARKEGYLAALKAHHLPRNEAYVFESEVTWGYGAWALRHLLALPEPPTAVLAADDLLALDALLYAVDAGLAVPDELAIVGYGDIPSARLVRPRLSTVRWETRDVAVAAVSMLTERIESDQPLPARHRTVDYALIARESS